MNDERHPCHTKHCVIPSLAVFHSQVEGASLVDVCPSGFVPVVAPAPPRSPILRIVLGRLRAPLGPRVPLRGLRSRCRSA